jgi:ribosome-associated heat shock protein Hsp15
LLRLFLNGKNEDIIRMGVRIDKYLWAVRVFKTRSLAADAIKGGKVKCGSEPIKPSREVKIGDEYVIQLSEIRKTIRVKEILENRVAAKFVADFMEDLTPESEYQSIHRLKESVFVFRPRGTGRPSKKQRRDIEEWFGDEPQSSNESSAE